MARSLACDDGWEHRVTPGGERVQMKPSPVLQFRAGIEAGREEGEGLDYRVNPQNISNNSFHRAINNSAPSVCQSGR